MPYMFKNHEEVFRVLMTSVDLRYYTSSPAHYTGDSRDGFYAGPYLMYGEFNIGLYRASARNHRDRGRGLSGGLSTGYKFYLTPRFRLDVNVGLGYAHLWYDRYLLGSEYVGYPLEPDKTRTWVGPTKLGVHLTYNLFR
jgi:hypothetical protein